MSLVRVHNLSVSLDGLSTGADQSLEAPFGHPGDRLMRWFTGTRSFRLMQGQKGGTTGIDDAFASNWGPGIGVEIMGRNKFGPQRGLERRGVEGLVGRGAAVPYPRLRAHPSRQALD